MIGALIPRTLGGAEAFARHRIARTFGNANICVFALFLDPRGDQRHRVGLSMGMRIGIALKLRKPLQIAMGRENNMHIAALRRLDHR